MIKLVYCITRRQGMSTAAFSSRWLEQHGPKVAERQNALRATKYVQSHTVEPELNDLLQQSRGLQPPYDGITEIWRESVEVARAAMATPEGAQAMQELLEDESAFIDFEHSRLFFTEEHDIF
jgi:uncharacterized protein (TIGR02118 family)